jgi:anthranilate synthase component 1
MNTKLRFQTTELPADTLTPVGIYLRLRDIYPSSLLLECSDYSSGTNAFSYICVRPVAGIEVTGDHIRTWFPDGREDKSPVKEVVANVNDFIDSFVIEGVEEDNATSHGLFGFTSFDSAFLFARYDESDVKRTYVNREVPFLKYDFFKVILKINHFNDTLSVTEYYSDDLPGGETVKIVSLLANQNLTTYPFRTEGEEESLISDSEYKKMVREAIRHCSVGDVFQLVVSRRYRQKFSGDEFLVYRYLRSVNPSPYLFYFDYIAYKIFGSSPEAQLKIGNGRAIINPIAGTIRRTGDAASDLIASRALRDNPKENSEHVMLVDLARNDLNRNCNDVKVDIYREVQTFSHLMHLVSTVSGELKPGTHPFTVFSGTFPAGTLSGAPKHKAIQLINRLESVPRGYYGGAVGFIGTDGTLNHAITIRSFLSKNGYLNYQAGAGIVINSSEDGELNEVNNKLDALRAAVKKAESSNKI